MLCVPSRKQIQSIEESNSRINIWEGAVRSGKSFSCLLRWIKFIRQGPPGNMVIIGKTERTVKRNIIKPMEDLLRNDIVYRQGAGEINIWGRSIYIVGANDERAEGKIRGATFVGALVDEISLIPENFFKMLLSRLSVDGAKLFGTTNPDSPFHWLKKEFIDRKSYLNLSVFPFRIEDNPSLSKDYVENLKKEYSGLWYERFINGSWVVAEGAVYDFFDQSIHVIDYPPGPAEYYVVGIDYGTTNPTVFTLIGCNSSLYPNRWLEKEYYYDSVAHKRQKTDSEYAKDLEDFIRGYPIKAIYLDPSAASFKLELRRMGINGVKDAVNDVLDGIRFQSKLLCNGGYKICSNCTHAIQEYSTYLWDSKSSEKGDDKPLKRNDHCCDAQRYALYTHFFNMPEKRMQEEEADWMQSKYMRVY